jgi:ParB-like chromosome segregation protein Spo0J
MKRTTSKKKAKRTRTLQSKKQKQSRSVAITEDADDKKIAALRVERRKLRSLKSHPKNPRKHPKKGSDEYETLHASLSDEYFDPLVFNERNGMLVSGHLRKKIFVADGVVEADVVIVDCDERTHVARMIAANHGAGEDDLPKLSNLIDDLRKEGDFDLRLTGMTIAEVDEVSTSKKKTPDDDSGGVDTGEEDVSSFEVFAQQEIEDDAFDFFRDRGFPYRDLPIHLCKQEINRLAALPESKRLRSNIAYHVADTYHKHRFHAAASGKRSPLDSFEDDEQLKRAIRLELEFGNGRVSDGLFGSMLLVRGTQSCSNFRPAFASLLYREFCRDLESPVVLDTSTGYGGRLVGFMGSNLQGAHYVGIDPNTVTHAANERMSADLGFDDQVTLINLPAEDVDVDEHDIREACDFAFTSPPYFTKELYSDEDTQSCVRYTEPDEWREGFLKRMLQLQFDALKPDTYNIVNIADVKVSGKFAPLSEWIVEDAIEAGFEFIERRDFEMSRRFGANLSDEVASEPVFVFYKPA